MSAGAATVAATASSVPDLSILVTALNAANLTGAHRLALLSGL